MTGPDAQPPMIRVHTSDALIPRANLTLRESQACVAPYWVFLTVLQRPLLFAYIVGADPQGRGRPALRILVRGLASIAVHGLCRPQLAADYTHVRRSNS